MKVKVGVEVDTNRLNHPTVHTVSLTTASTIVENLTITPTTQLPLLPCASCTYYLNLITALAISCESK